MRVLVLDDFEAIRTRFVSYLQQLGCRAEFLQAATEDEAKTLIGTEDIALALLDIQLQQGDGINVLRYLREKSNQVRIVMFTNQASDQHRELCLTLGANAFYDKSREIDSAVGDVLQYIKSLEQGEQI